MVPVSQSQTGQQGYRHHSLESLILISSGKC